jgi:hypothetical protein
MALIDVLRLPVGREVVPPLIAEGRIVRPFIAPPAP